MSGLLTAGVLQQAANVKNTMLFTVDTTLAGSASNEFILPVFSVQEVLVKYEGKELIINTEGNHTLTFDTPGIHKIEIGGIAGQVMRFNNGGDKDKITSLERFGMLGWTTAERTFYGCTNLVEIIDTNGEWCANVTNFNVFAFNCSSLETLDVSGWNTANVTSFDDFVGQCPSLQTLEVSNWDTAKVTTFYAFAYGCSSLTTLDVSNWDTANVTTFFFFAYGCSSLTTLDVSNWDTANVTNFRYFVFNCSSLEALDCQNWNIGKVGNLGNFATGVSIPTLIYDQILIKWEAQAVKPNLTADFGTSKYSSAAQAARDSLTNENTNNWIINDGGLAV